jgi:hypothetical protein
MLFIGERVAKIEALNGEAPLIRTRRGSSALPESLLEGSRAAAGEGHADLGHGLPRS